MVQKDYCEYFIQSLPKIFHGKEIRIAETTEKWRKAEDPFDSIRDIEIRNLRLWTSMMKKEKRKKKDGVE